MANLTEFTERYRKLNKYEQEAADRKREARSNTICGFDWPNNECRHCFKRKACEETVRSADRLAWDMESRVRIAYDALLKELIQIPEEDRDIPCRELMARIYRSIARNPSVISEDDQKYLHRARELFDELYYSTGDPEYRSQAESLRFRG